MYFLSFTKDNKRHLKQTEIFLNKNDLKLSKDIEEFGIFKFDGEIIACGGLSKNILKCLAVDSKFRGDGLLLKLILELMQIAQNKGESELFVFSKIENLELFRSCGFELISKIDNLFFSQHGKQLQKFKQNLSTFKTSHENIGSIVMNANPFTKGHQFLVESALKHCEFLYVFVVEENSSEFSFQERFFMVKEALKDLKNVCVLKGGEFIISKATFPTYFLKSSKEIESSYSRLDATIFKEHIAPILNIKKRFVGSEPTCVVTNEYNNQLENILNDNIEVIKIDRFCHEKSPISASIVRELIKNKTFNKLSMLVPQTTLNLILKKEEQGGV